MLPSVYLDLPEQEATKEFASARNRALLRRIGAFLRTPPSSNQLLSLDEATARMLADRLESLLATVAHDPGVRCGALEPDSRLEGPR